MQPLGYNILIGLAGRQFDIDCLIPHLSLSNQVGQREIGIRSGNQVAMVIFQQIVLDALCHTAQNADDEFALALNRIQRVQTVIDFLFCIVTHRTGVQEYGICLINSLSRFISCHLHDRSHNLRVCYIHLAAVSLNIQFLHLSLKKAPPQQHATVPFYLFTD